MMSLFCVAACLSSVVMCARQGSKQPPQTKTKVDLKYDKAKNLSSVTLPLSIWEGISKTDSLDLDVTFAYPGHVIVTPSMVRFRFFVSDDPAFGINDEALVFHVDGARLDLGNMKEVHHSNRTEGEYIKSTFQVFELSVPYDKLTQIVKGKLVKIELGGRKYDLSSKNLKALSDFAELMKQNGQEFK